jgi:hypothetical protein
VQLTVAKHTYKALESWWSVSRFESNLYLQRGANKKANIDEKENQYEFWKEPSVFTPTKQKYDTGGIG